MKKNDLDRRDFLKSLLVGSGSLWATPLDIYLSNVILHFLQRSNALAANDEAAFSDKKFIHLSMVGGIPRYYWDLPLTPNGETDLGTPNKMLITKFSTNSGGEVTGGTYATTKVGNYYLPHIWSGRIPTPNGSAPMAALAQNMLILRGIDLQIDSHELDRYKQTMINGHSLLGLVADQATTPIPASAYIAGKNFYNSKKGIPLAETSSGSPLAELLTPFTGGNALTSITDSYTDKTLDRIFQIMNSSAQGKHKYIPNTYEQRHNAKVLLKKDFTKLRDSYAALFNKYQSLINRSYGDQTLALAGVETQAIETVMDDPRYRLMGNDGLYVPGDLRSLTDGATSINNLAASMAVAEYMITEGFSSSVSVSSGAIESVKVSGGKFETGAPVSRDRMGLNTDVHEQGAFSNLILQTRFARAQSSCLYELINQLKSIPTSQGNIFNQTAIAVTSEFNRSPRADGSGADHGWMGSSYTIYSGQIPELMVIGNCREGYGLGTNGRGATGKWVGAPVEEIGNRVMLIGNVASTFSTILDLESPTPNDTSLVYRKNGVIRPITKGPKNV